jgi:hypothetical protein
MGEHGGIRGEFRWILWIVQTGQSFRAKLQFRRVFIVEGTEQD